MTEVEIIIISGQIPSIRERISLTLRGVMRGARPKILKNEMAFRPLHQFS